MSKAELEKRQLAKVIGNRVRPEDTPFPLPLANDPRAFRDLDKKTVQSLIRAYRKDSRLRHSEKQLELAKEIGLGSLAALLYSGGQIVKSGVEGVLDVEAAIAGNPDPVAQGVAIGAQVIPLIAFSRSPLGKWLFHITGFDTIPLFKNVPAPPTIPTGGAQPHPRTLYPQPLPTDPNFEWRVAFTYPNVFDLSHPLNGEEAFSTLAARQAWIKQNQGRITVTALSPPDP